MEISFFSKIKVSKYILILARVLVLDRLEEDTQIEIKDKTISLSTMNKTFEFAIIKLDDDYEFPEFTPKVEWKTNDKISEISRVYTYMDNGPLIINSIKSGFDFSWIIAPKFY